MAGATNDNSQFAFVVNFVALQFFGQNDGIQWILDCGAGLHEQHGIFRDGGFAFFRVLAVVQSDTQDVDRLQGCQQFTGNRLVGGAEFAKQFAIESGVCAIRILAGQTNGSVFLLQSNNFHELIAPCAVLLLKFAHACLAMPAVVAERTLLVREDTRADVADTTIAVGERMVDGRSFAFCPGV